MAIARDATASSYAGGQSGTVTLSHTCTGSNLMLWVTVYLNGGGTGDNVTGITYAGTSMTRTANGYVNGASTSQFLYYLIAPSTGANNIVVSLSGTHGCGIVSASYTGAKQSGQPDSSNSGSDLNTGANQVTVATTVVASNCWLVGGDGNDSIAPSAGTGTSINASANTGSILFIDSNGTVGTGSRSMQVTYLVPNDSLMCIASMAPLGATNFTRSPSDSIMNGASRTTTVARLVSFFRALSDSVMNAASRFALVGKGYARNLSDSIMNAVSRFATLVGIQHSPVAYVRALSDSIMNGANRFTTLAMSYFRTAQKSAAVTLSYFQKNNPPTDYD